MSWLLKPFKCCKNVIVLSRNNNNNNNNVKNDKACTHLHYSICTFLGIETADKWYTHMPKPVYEEGDVTVLWNKAVHTEKLQQIGQI